MNELFPKGQDLGLGRAMVRRWCEFCGWELVLLQDNEGAAERHFLDKEEFWEVKKKRGEKTGSQQQTPWCGRG